MRDVLTYFHEREEEFSNHLAIARMLEARVGEEVSGSVLQVQIRHINTIKSGIIIHLYNIVEAVSTKTLETVGQTVVMKRPALWTEAVLKEWIRGAIWSGEERIGDSALTKLASVSRTLASGVAPPSFTVKGERGSWDDESIFKVANRLGCQLDLAPDISRAALEKVYLNDTTAMTFLAKKRNAIAHGSITFEEGARDMTLGNLNQLGDRVLPFLKAVTESYKAYLDDEAYLQAQETAV